MSKIIAMIPARMGSKRVKNKNIRLLNGKPMVQYVIDAAIDAGCFDEVWVNSESDIVAKIAKSCGANFYKRSQHLCGDQVGSDLLVHDFIGNVRCDIVVQILPTSPFITPEQIRNFVLKSKDCDTLISVTPVRIESMFNNKPINFDQKKPTPPSQDLTPIQSYACSLMAWKTKNYLNNMAKYGCAYHGGSGNIKTFEITGFSAIDIDEEKDFILAEVVAKSISLPPQTPRYYDGEEILDADRLRVLIEDGVINNNMFNYNKERVSVKEIIANNPEDVCWSHTLVNSPSTCATLIAQMPGEGNRMHYHSDWDEWWLIMKGEWEWCVEGKTISVKEGDIVYIERFKRHKITAAGDKQAIRLAVSREDVNHIYELRKNEN